MFPASLPEVTAVGGTEFDEGTGNYWGGSSSPFALSYIPEISWNDKRRRRIGRQRWRSKCRLPAAFLAVRSGSSVR